MTAGPLACRLLASAALVLMAAGSAAAESPRALYANAKGREEAVRAMTGAAVTVQHFRAAMAEYERLARRYPQSGYSDNALWQAAGLALDAFQRFGDLKDRETALRLLKRLTATYPTSSLLRGAPEKLRALEATSDAAGVTPAPSERPTTGGTAASPAAAPVVATIRDVTATKIPGGVRVTVELDGEIAYREERIASPDRVFLDLRGAQPAAPLKDATIATNKDIVRHIRLGRHPNNTTRLVLDLDGVVRYSVFTLYNPFRLVIDCERATATPLRSERPVGPAATPARGPAPTPPALAPARTALPDPSPSSPLVPPAPLQLTPVVERARMKMPPSPILAPPFETNPTRAPPVERQPTDALAGDATRLQARPLTPPPPAPPANATGGFSLARQLGLGVSRIVIDPGHGGHDPGAKGTSLTEADLVLDIARRVEKLLLKEPGVEVVMTRRTDVFIPLDERTAIANREGADLFLSIHANASRSPSARGVETYYLNFASTPDAAIVAARENAVSGQAMHSLPEIVRAIALNTKLDESRDLAETVQRAMLNRLRNQNKQLRNLGVKQAPFVVLIGASMPSVLAEVSFVTNRHEHQLLRTSAYRQRIAQALVEAVLRYQKSLKTVGTVAEGR